jgi:hypothetical protein
MWGMADDPGIWFLMSGVAVGETIDYQESPSEEGVGACISRLIDPPCVPLLSPQEFLVPSCQSLLSTNHTAFFNPHDH